MLLSNSSTNTTNSLCYDICPVGTIKSPSGLFCENCPKGYYNNLEGADICKFCLPGSYNNFTGATICQPCPNGTSSFLANSYCFNSPLCPIGQGLNLNGFLCIDCYPGYYKNFTGSSACIKCPAGTYSKPSMLDSCLNCPAGTFNPNTNALDQTWCQKCGIGTYSIEGSSACIYCPAGKFIPDNGIGQYITACINCQAGFSSFNNTCIACPEGKYNPTPGNDCLPCPAGTFNGKTAQISCSQCIEGYFSVSGFTICSICDAGTSSLSGSGSCTKCSVGSYNEIPGGKCIICPAGTYNNKLGSSSLNECISCPPGNRSPSGSISQASCIPCPSGTYLDLDICKECPIGTYNAKLGSFSNQDCLNCPDGASSFKGSNTCFDCDIGTYSNLITSNICVKCPPGTYNSIKARSNCLNCSAGLFNNYSGSTSSDSCKFCNDGESSFQGSSACGDCSFGNGNIDNCDNLRSNSNINMCVYRTLSKECINGIIYFQNSRQIATFEIIFIWLVSFFLILSVIACFYYCKEKEENIIPFINFFLYISDILSDIGFCFGSIYPNKNKLFISLIFILFQPFTFLVLGIYYYSNKKTGYSFFYKVLLAPFYLILYTISSWFKLIRIGLSFADDLLKWIKLDQNNLLEIRIDQAIVMAFTQSIPNLIFQSIFNSSAGQWTTLNILSCFVSIIDILSECHFIISNANKVKQYAPTNTSEMRVFRNAPAITTEMDVSRR